MIEPPPNEKCYTALTGDIVGSRTLTNRSKFQENLRREIQGLSEIYQDSLVGRIALIKGDEVQALFLEANTAGRLVQELSDRLFPVQFAFGLGYGRLTTNKDPDPGNMDGPCFHHARTALERAQRERRWVRVQGFSPQGDSWISTTYQLLQTIRSRWTLRQMEILHLARDRQQIEVASILDVSPSVVSESLKSAAFPSIIAGEELVIALLDNFARPPAAEIGSTNHLSSTGEEA